MCGRYVLKSKFGLIVDAFSPVLPRFPEDLFAPRYNVAPTQKVPVVRESAGEGRVIELMTWGLIPFWSKDGKPGPINARVETLKEKPTFRSAYEKRRCLVPADGFYEWMKTPEGKRPHLIRMNGGEIFAFGGVWERWKSGETTIDSFAILTTRPNSLMARIHDRMPVIIRRKDYASWLGETGATPGAEVLEPISEQEMQAIEVGTRVNSVKNDDHGCIEPLV
jgi:putative SOS response-associated peptidase YedK